MAFDSKKFLVRTGSAAVFVLVLLGCIFWNYYSFSALFLVVSLWGLHEFYKLMEITGAQPQKSLGFAVGGLLYFSVFLLNIPKTIMDFELGYSLTRFGVLLLGVTFFILFLVPITELFRNRTNPMVNVSVSIYGILYAVLPFVLFNFYSLSSDGFNLYEPKRIMGLFLLIWSNDTFAYLVGSFIGRNKMFERISPGKTWEGTIGGAILTIASSYLIYKWFGLFELHEWMIIASIVAVFGTLGDLVESMLKRSVRVKDSGKIMPGHGGILDRFDSLIMVIPFVFLYLILK